MHCLLRNLLAVLTITMLITASSCNPAPTRATNTTTFPLPSLTSTATQPPPTLTPTATRPAVTPAPTYPSSKISLISAGGDYTCLLTASGGVRCWGANSYGQLGDGTTIHRSTPVDVVGLGSRAVAIAAGGDQTCALTSEGGVKCWGLNESGQLGDGTTNNSSRPVDVVSLGSGVVSISTRGGRACAVTAAGGVKCWGLIWYGQWVEGKPNFNTTPVDVAGLSSGVVAVSNGYGHICALTTAGGVKCWGFNLTGQLGDGTAKEGSSIPVDVVGLGSKVAAISAGSNYTCALMESSGVKCWGDNTWGQVGDGTMEEKSRPVDVPGLGTGVVAVTAGSGHTCALTESGGVKCWGSNQDGYLGDGTTSRSSMPVNVTGLSSGVIVIAAAHMHTCALTATGVVKCWGNNEFGQLGDGLPPICVTPVEVMGLTSGVSEISVGGVDACALLAAGGVKCWGHDFLTEGSTSERSSPMDMVSFGGGLKAISVGSIFYLCALTASGGVKCLDNNQTPVDVVGLESGVNAVFTGGEHMCVLTSSGGVKCWGQNEYGQLGDGTTEERSVPVDVIGLESGVSAVSPGYFHTCALMASGGVKCWGWNGFGQLGDGTAVDRLTPADVVGLGNGVSAIASGGYHTCVLTTSGGVKCWGQNEEGQLGNGTHALEPVLTPVDVVGLSSGVSAITAGETHTCALTLSGGVKCWGWNYYGQLGDGTLADRTIPVDVVSLGSGVVAMDAGLNYNCALADSGGVRCWGNDSIGQMGDGRMLWSSVPVDVTG